MAVIFLMQCGVLGVPRLRSEKTAAPHLDLYEDAAVRWRSQDRLLRHLAHRSRFLQPRLAQPPGDGLRVETPSGKAAIHFYFKNSLAKNSISLDAYEMQT